MLSAKDTHALKTLIDKLEKFDKESVKSVIDFMTYKPRNVNAHAELVEGLTELYAKKNHDYGDSFAKGFAEYGLIMPAIRLEDKLMRFKSLLRSPAQVDDESIRDTLLDLANYAIMTVMELDRQKECGE